MKIGKLVQRHIPAIFEYCETKDASEFTRLQDARYSKEALEIIYPFCKPIASIGAKKPDRHYVKEFAVCGIQVRVTNEWKEKSLPLFKNYLRKCNIGFDDSFDEASDTPTCANTKERKASARFKPPSIGNGQNGVIRYILSQLDEEQFNANDWEQVKADFGQCCAYCGTDGKLEREHVIPINRDALGEHRLGNLVPACQSCNAKKAGDDFREFLAESPDRITTIESHMAKHGYEPIGDHTLIKSILEMAHADVRQLAERYIALIEAVLAEERTIIPLK